MHISIMICCVIYADCSLAPNHTQCPQLTTSMVVDKRLDISDNFMYVDVDQQPVYVKIDKQFWDLREQMLAGQNEDN